MNGVEMALLAAEELKGKEMARRVTRELKTSVAILACTVDLVLTVKFLEKEGLIPKGLSEKVQEMAEVTLKGQGVL